MKEQIWHRSPVGDSINFYTISPLRVSNQNKQTTKDKTELESYQLFGYKRFKGLRIWQMKLQG